MRKTIQRIRLIAVIAPALLLTGCGGGGSGGVASTPTPTTPPITGTPTTSTPTTAVIATTPSTVNYNDAEYQRSNAAVAANALAAYSAGATGAGVKIGIIDSGLSNAGGQFTGRIDPASTDLVANRGITDEGGHGTSVAGVAAAGRDGSDILGVAFNATLLIARTDTVGSCASSGGCTHNDNALAQGIDLARQNGVRVINMSLGGSQANGTVVAAVRRAAAAGIIVVISAGNDGTANPDAFAQIASDAATNGMVIIAGSHDAAGVTSSFSDKAGTYGQFYLTALGERVRSFDENFGHFLFSGTSYSAPTISGAVALLAQAFPNLTGKQIISLLYSTATDAGTAGVDTIYGNGLLNLTKAFQPQGSSSLAGSAIPVSLASNGTISTAMGDAVTGASIARTVILDGYGRAYSLNVAGTIGRAAIIRPLTGSLVGDIRTTNLGNGPIAISMNIAHGSIGQPAAGVRALGLSDSGARLARFLSARILARIDARTQAVFGMAEGVGRLSAMLDGRVDIPFLVARDSDATPGFASHGNQTLAIRRDFGFAGLTIASERGIVAKPVADRLADDGYAMIDMRLDRRFGRMHLSGGGGMMRESGSVLGARFGAALGGGGATTRVLDVRVDWDLGRGWALAGTIRQGWTRADAGGALQSGRLSSNAFTLDIVRQGRDHRLGLRVAQPMRVEQGGYDLNLPASYDYATGLVSYARQRLNLAPKGREIDVEGTYGRYFAGGWIDMNLFLRSQPGNVATAAPDRGVALRYSLGF
jgi:subtilisin family serine protease